MKVNKKVELPDVITIEIEDAKFSFERPSNLDFFKFELRTRAGVTDYVFSKLKKIEGVVFEEDNKPVGVEYFKDLPADMIQQIIDGYSEKATDFFNQEAELKKARERKESPDS